MAKEWILHTHRIEQKHLNTASFSKVLQARKLLDKKARERGISIDIWLICRQACSGVLRAKIPICTKRSITISVKFLPTRQNLQAIFYQLFSGGGSGFRCGWLFGFKESAQGFWLDFEISV